MRKRKSIKINVDMFEDTKFKIIDSMKERDTICYIWTRILALCGKINNDNGDLFVSKGMPYTIEILALEFNRTEEQIRNAIDVFIKLNMMSKDDEIGVLSVCNWGKHQGIRKNKVSQTEEKSKNDREIKINLIKDNNIKEEMKHNKSIAKDNETKVNSNIKEYSEPKRCKSNTKNEAGNIDQNSIDKNESVVNKNIMEEYKLNTDMSATKNNNYIFDVKNNKGSNDKIKIKPKKKRKNKKDIEEIIMFEEEPKDLDMCGVDIPIEECGRVISSFSFT